MPNMTDMTPLSKLFLTSLELRAKAKCYRVHQRWSSRGRSTKSHIRVLTDDVLYQVGHLESISEGLCRQFLVVTPAYPRVLAW